MRKLPFGCHALGVYSRAAVLIFTLFAPRLAIGQACVGDCDGDGQVTVDEILIGVNIPLGTRLLSACPSFDRNGSGEVEVDELVTAVDFSLRGCPVVPTATLTPTTVPSATSTATTAPSVTATAPPSPSPSPSYTLTLLPTSTATSAPTGTPADTPTSSRCRTFSPAHEVPPVPVAFRDVTAEMGLPGAGLACLAFRDFDNDGRPDLLLAPVDQQKHFARELAVYLNRGSHFEKVGIPVPFRRIRSCTVGDIDNDGWQDIVVSGRVNDTDTLSGDPADAAFLKILRNNGQPALAFDDVSGAVNDLLPPNPMVHVLFDYDNDGWLDLLVGYYFWEFFPANTDYTCTETPTDFYCKLIPDPPHVTPVLLRNLKGTGFEKPPQSGLVGGFVDGFSVVDWNGDGLTDVIQSTEWGRSELYLNQGGGVFSDVFPSLTTLPYGHAMGFGIGDFNLDGRWDLYLTDFGPDQFYFATPDGRFEDRAALLGIQGVTRNHSGWSPIAADLNNDGWLDLYQANILTMKENVSLQDWWDTYGLAALGTPPIDFVFMNAGHGEFDLSCVPHGEALQQNTDLLVAATADFDGDGLLDIVEAGYTSNFNLYSAEVRLLHNETRSAGRHWIAIHLVGTSVNRDATGAVVFLRDGDTELDRRPVGTGGIAVSQAPVHFGLGERTSVSSIIVRWPGGKEQTVPGPIAADQIIEVVEQ